MKRFFLSFLMLLTLINWLPTHAEAQALTVSIPNLEGTQAETFTIYFYFSAAVDDFVEGDITLTPSTLADVTDFGGFDGSDIYSAEITPRDGQQGTLKIEVLEGVARKTGGTETNEGWIGYGRSGR